MGAEKDARQRLRAVLLGELDNMEKSLRTADAEMGRARAAAMSGGWTSSPEERGDTVTELSRLRGLLVQLRMGVKWLNERLDEVL